MFMDYYGLSKIDPKTRQVVAGMNPGQYYYRGPDGKYGYFKTPPLATQPLVGANGGKLKRKTKKRKGYTF